MDQLKICRACLAEDEPMFSLFEMYEHELSLAVILQSCITTAVYEGDGLPSYLCDKCIQILTQFYNFTIIYEQSEEHLRSLLKKTVKKEPQEIIKFQHHARGVQYFGNEVNPGDIISNLEDYEYIAAKNNSTRNDSTEEMTFITLDAIKSENLDLEICNAFSAPENITKRDINFTKGSASDPEVEEIVKFECTECGEEHLYLTAFRNHMRIKHGVHHVNPSEYSSTINIKVPKSEPIVQELTQAHDDILGSEPSFECEICSKKFHFQGQLNKHVKLHELTKKFICEICGAGFIRKTYLDDHKEGHSLERKHACPFCGKRFRRRTVLRAHKRSHTHRNHYVCELCGRAFTGKGTLRTHHLLIHVRERNFACMICHQKFPLKSTLNKHVQRHEKREKGEKGFNCTDCDMEYRDKSSLKRHIEVKHLGNVVLVQCPDCPKEYSSNANLQKHRKRHHALDDDM